VYLKLEVLRVQGDSVRKSNEQLNQVDQAVHPEKDGAACEVADYTDLE
jgi:hypothetical protein